MSCSLNNVKQDNCVRYGFINWKYSALTVEMIASRSDVKPYVSKEVLAGVARHLRKKADQLLNKYESFDPASMSEEQKEVVIPEMIKVAKDYIEVMQELEKYSYSYEMARASVIHDAISKVIPQVEREAQQPGSCYSHQQFLEQSIKYALPLLAQNASKQDTEPHPL